MRDGLNRKYWLEGELLLAKGDRLYVLVTPRSDEVHSTCNCRGTYMHQVPL